MSDKASNTAPNRLAYEQFKSNTPAVAGAIFIFLCILIAIFAYQIVPDGSPNANRQITELNLAPAGTQSQVLKVKNNHMVASASFLKRFFIGEEDSYTLVPFDEYKIQNDSIVLFQNEYKYKSFHLLDAYYALSNKPQVKDERTNLAFINSAGANLTINKTKLAQLVKNKNIKNIRFWLGTDQYGRDVLSRLIIGVRISLLAGLIAVIISVLLGTTLGMLAGYFGGRIDTIITFFINTVWSIPTLLLVFAIVIAMGKSIFNIFLAVGLTMWVDVARIVRGQVLTLKDAPYIEAMKVMGTPMPRIMLRHLLPNLIGPLLVIAAANFATAILLEAGLSYLGFGIQPPTPSWGTMLNEHYGFAIGGKPLLALIPAIAILLLVLSFNLVGNGLRDAFDVKGSD